MLNLAYWANWAIWAAFTAEYVTVLTLTGRRWAYTRRAWLDAFIITTSFPLLPSLLAGTRLLRVARLTVVLRMLRLARLAAVSTLGGSAAKVLFHKRGLGYIAILTLLIALGVGGVFAIVEGSAMIDGFWWAIVTITTVGYGDMFPLTPASRAAATVLMLLGIGFVAFITAAVAAHFVEDDDAGTAERLPRVNEHSPSDRSSRGVASRLMTHRRRIRPLMKRNRQTSRRGRRVVATKPFPGMGAR